MLERFVCECKILRYTKIYFKYTLIGKVNFSLVMSDSSYSDDVEIFGPDTRYLGIRSDPADQRIWLRDAPVCSELVIEYKISHVGILDAQAPFTIHRVRQSGTYFLACLEGRGQVLVDGTWKSVHAGQACLLPPFVSNSFKCEAGQRWRFVGVRYLESVGDWPMIAAWSPMIGSFQTEALQSAVMGLRAEVIAGGNSATLHHWCALIHLYVQAFARPANPDPRLWRLWQQIEQNPGRDWTLAEMAAIACVSREHLRRLCQEKLGRSPVSHLTFIRLQCALAMITKGEEKITTIAMIVGFANIHSFSAAFKSRYGVAPSRFRVR